MRAPGSKLLTGALLLLAGLHAACSELLTDPFEYGTIEVSATRRTGEPVPNVRLTLHTGTRHLGYGTTGEDGRFVFRFVPFGDLGVFAEPPDGYRPLDLAEGYVVSHRMPEGGEANLEFTYLKFGPGSLVVRTEEPSGEPVGAVRLQLFTSSGVVAEGRTGDDGVFTFEEVPFGEYGVFAYPHPPFQFAAGAGMLGIADGLLIDEGYEERVLFTMERCEGRIRVRAVDVDGNPVTALGLQLYTSQGIVAEGRTDGAGVHEFQAVACGDYGIFIERRLELRFVDGGATWLVDGLLLGMGELSEVQLTFERCEGLFRARVVDAAGGAVEGARVVLYDPQGIIGEGRTDAAGVYDFGAVPCHTEYGVMVEPPAGYAVEEGRGSSYFDGIGLTEGEEGEVTFTVVREG